MRVGLYVNWAIWAALVVLHLVAYASSIPTTAPLRMLSGSTAEALVFRPFPAPLYFEIVFQKQPGLERPELIVSHTKRFQRFNDANVHIDVSIRGATTMFEMRPEIANHWERIGSSAARDFIPATEEDATNTFDWSVTRDLIPILPAGITKVIFSTHNAGLFPPGEQATINILAPISFKEPHSEAYGHLGLFVFFQPIDLILLLIYVAVLTRKTVKARKLVTQRT